ncbi:MAG: YraN family protein [Vampirovibrio sp.]|nr:YraN family protein [Vampirovibrio sp.]
MTTNASPYTSKRQSLGKQGERLAIKFLEEKGYSIQHINWRAGKLGEIDIIASPPPEKPFYLEFLVFVEVKTRRNQGFVSSLEAITPEKQRRMVIVAEAYLQQRNLTETQVRFDLIAITVYPTSDPSVMQHPPDIIHLENCIA